MFQILSTVSEKSEQQKIRRSILSQGEDITKTPKFEFSVTVQLTKMIRFNFSKASSCLVRWTFKIFSFKISKIKFEFFCCCVTELWEIYIFGKQAMQF